MTIKSSMDSRWRGETTRIPLLRLSRRGEIQGTFTLAGAASRNKDSVKGCLWNINSQVWKVCCAGKLTPLGSALVTCETPLEHVVNYICWPMNNGNLNDSFDNRLAFYFGVGRVGGRVYVISRLKSIYAISFLD